MISIVKVSLNKIYKQKLYIMKTIENLNNLLSTSAVFYQNVRTYHWYVKGPRFFDLHEKFELLYTETALTVDELAERILMLEGKPLHSLTQYLSNSAIKETSTTTGADAMVKEVVEALEVILKIERETLAEASENNDEGTVSLMSDLIGKNEKHLWMFKAFLG